MQSHSGKIRLPHNGSNAQTLTSGIGQAVLLTVTIDEIKPKDSQAATVSSGRTSISIAAGRSASLLTNGDVGITVDEGLTCTGSYQLTVL